MHSFARKFAPFPLVIIILLFTVFSVFAQENRSFHNIDKSEPFYGEHIQKLLDHNIVIGYTDDEGKFTGIFGPQDLMTRAAFTKMNVRLRLAETIANWNTFNIKEADSKIDGLLLDYYNCSDNPSICESIGYTEFKDVPPKSNQCDKEKFTDPKACEPWFGQYVYYAANKEFVKGYGSKGSQSFRPGDKILRIHALKMILADDGNIDPKKDTRFARLNKEANNLNSTAPTCLIGADLYILNDNGQNNADAKKLLAYAKLADRLDFFGNDCSFFKDKHLYSPKQRSDYLLQPLKRQEAARWMAIATTYAPLKPNRKTNTTLNTKAQNAETLANRKDNTDPGKIYQEGIDKGVIGSDSQNPNNANNNPTNCPKGDPTCQSNLNGNTANTTNTTDQDAGANGVVLASGLGDIDMPIKLPSEFPTLQEYISVSKQGRCCQIQSLYPENLCKNIKYSDYVVDQENEVNWDYPITLWHRAIHLTNPNDKCWAISDDIKKGYYGDQISYVDGSLLLDRDSQADNEILLNGIFLILSTLINTDGAIDSAKKEFSNWSEEAIKIWENLEFYYKNHLLEETKHWGMSNWTVGSWQYQVVMTWYEKKMNELPDDSHLDAAIIKTVRFSKHTLFLSLHPFIAFEIGISDGSDNISSMATRFAVYSDLSENSEYEGSQVNALRHVIWQAEITKRYGANIAKKAGDAHEINSGVIDDKKLNIVLFNNLSDADESIDLRNNIIGRSIGEANADKTMKELALISLEYFWGQGLWTAEKLEDGAYLVKREKIGILDYVDALDNIAGLTENAR